jgi:RNA polymerase sigma-70 factor, ECF subfamily
MGVFGAMRGLKKEEKNESKSISRVLFLSNTNNRTNRWGESALISLLKQGDEEAFRALIRRYQKALYSVAYGITLDRDESQEILQEVFIKVYRSIGSFREESSLSTWLHRITVNLCLNWQRKSKRRPRWDSNSSGRKDSAERLRQGGDKDRPDVLYEEKELTVWFKRWLQGLPEEERTVFVLKEANGLSYEEIARILHIKRGTVSSRLFYARKKLKESLIKYEKAEYDLSFQVDKSFIG